MAGDTNSSQTAGTPSGPEPADSDQKIFIDENEWLEKERELSELRGYKQAMQEVELRLGQQHPEIPQQQPTPPPKPEFQYHSEEELQTALDAGDLKSYHRMNRHNSDTKLAEEIWKLDTTKIQPLQMTGVAAISELSGTVAQTGMTHLDIPEVKKTYQERLQSLKASGQVLTAETHRGVYEWAVGTHIDKVQAKFQEGFLRQQAQDSVNTPTDKSGRSTDAGTVTVPAVETFFEPAALTKLAQKYPGLSAAQAADKEFARHGGWDNYYKKFYGPKKEE